MPQIKVDTVDDMKLRLEDEGGLKKEKVNNIFFLPSLILDIIYLKYNIYILLLIKLNLFLGYKNNIGWTMYLSMVLSEGEVESVSE